MCLGTFRIIQEASFQTFKWSNRKTHRKSAKVLWTDKNTREVHQNGPGVLHGVARCSRSCMYKIMSYSRVNLGTSNTKGEQSVLP